MPVMPDAFVQEITERYIELYEKVTGLPFHKDNSSDPLQRIEAAVLQWLANA